MVAKKQRSSASSLKKRHFFKVLLGDFAHKLKIPPNFVKHIPKGSPRRVFLKGPGGSSWRVGLSETMKGTFLSCGWPKFVQDHSLKEYEFLVFRHDGDMHFNVQIFDKTACEREDVFNITTRSRATTCEGKNKRGRPLKRFSDVSCLVKYNENQNLFPNLVNGSGASNQLQHCFTPTQERSSLSSKPIGEIKVKTEADELPLCVITSQGKRRKGFLSRRRLVTVEERELAREAAYSFKSSYPHVILCMTETNVYSRYVLRFPVRFSRIHLPRERTNVLLRDPSGKEWEVFYIPDVRDRLSAGWFSFARGNNLEEGDFCVFELTGPLEFRVHIFRVVEETIPAIRVPKM